MDEDEVFQVMRKTSGFPARDIEEDDDEDDEEFEKELQGMMSGQDDASSDDEDEDVLDGGSDEDDEEINWNDTDDESALQYPELSEQEEEQEEQEQEEQEQEGKSNTKKRKLARLAEKAKKLGFQGTFFADAGSGDFADADDFKHLLDQENEVDYDDGQVKPKSKRMRKK